MNPAQRLVCKAPTPCPASGAGERWSPALDERSDDESLLRQLRTGDPKALDALLAAHGERMFALAYSLLGRRAENRADAEDIVQESLLGALRGASRFEGRSSLTTWLSRIVSNQCAAFRRYRRVRRADSLGSDNAPEPAGGAPENPEAKLDVERLLSALSPEHREVIVLRELQGFSYDEISETLGVPRGTVESRLFRARQTLKEKFPEFLAE
jgi:RNA polymerase sigma-70 factor, ECF subfamily